ncbi:putative kinase [Synechococcus sp. PCC 7502]|uniref:putative kinase n=1 Tax=Synechococcus sp. PCC 7502 TaxID=1173263 RepID=UPI00029FAAE0|nr:putative kinase [Synechococcus sp. PCC 7502]AFY75351.1 putative kinase [Synechococcus sp. PCC 7502]
MLYTSNFSDPNLLAVLVKLIGSSSLTTFDHNLLKANLLFDQASCQGFNVNSANIDEVIARRSQILKSIFNTTPKSKFPLPINESLIPTLWYVWIPLAMQLAAKFQGTPIIQGIIGGQGAGKTTMTKFLQMILAAMGYACVSFSLDDLYKTYAEREELKKLDPDIQWRGVPGTHDLELGINTLNQLCCDHSPWQIPRFDKSLYAGAGDRTDPETIFIKPQIILFEGWFVGVRPVDPVVINNWQGDRQFVHKMNHKLQDYLPLWQKLHSLWLLLPQDYRFSLGWRQDAESKQGKGMSTREIEKFVHYFWRSLPPEIFITPLSASADLVIELDSTHAVTALKFKEKS